jgi:hypothetical protein
VVAVVAPGHAVEGVVQVGGALGVDQQAAAGDRHEGEGDVEDHAGQPHAAGGGPEQLGVLVGADLDGAARRAQAQRPDVGGEGAVAVVVLAVDVRGDGAADGDVAGAGGDGHEPALGHGEAEEVVEAQAGLGGDDPGAAVEGQHLAHARGVGHRAAGVLGGVPVGAAQAPGDDATLAGCVDGGGEALGRRRVQDGRPGRRRAGPAGQLAHVRYTAVP